MFKRTTAINKLGKLTKRKKIIQGGTSAGKTYGILPLLINKAVKNPRLEISVVSESIPHLKRGAMKEEETARIQAELNKGDAAKVKDLIADLEVLKTKYSFKSAKNNKMYNDVGLLIDKVVNHIK